MAKWLRTRQRFLCNIHRRFYADIPTLVKSCNIFLNNVQGKHEFGFEFWPCTVRLIGPYWQSWTLSRTPVAPSWRYDRSLEKAVKNRGRPLLGSERGTHRLRGRPTCRLTLHSPTLARAHPRSGWVLVKAAWEGGERTVSSMQIPVGL